MNTLGAAAEGLFQYIEIAFGTRPTGRKAKEYWVLLVFPEDGLDNNGCVAMDISPLSNHCYLKKIVCVVLLHWAIWAPAHVFGLFS